MKQRILSEWTFTRVLYLTLGTVILIQSIIQLEWAGILFGGYFAAMGLFAFGCAAGNCFGGTCYTPPQQNSNTDIPDVKFQELKQK